MKEKSSLTIFVVAAIVGVLLSGCTSQQSALTPGTISGEEGTCVIGPNSGSNARSLGIGVITKATSVCDAATEGCGACLQLCSIFKKINDLYGCPPCAGDGWCNPTCATGQDPDCCIPNYVSMCDTTDGCGGTRDTTPYNGCELTSPARCGYEKVCNDGIDNDCDGKIDGQDMNCGPCPCYNEEWIKTMNESMGGVGKNCYISAHGCFKEIYCKWSPDQWGVGYMWVQNWCRNEFWCVEASGDKDWPYISPSEGQACYDLLAKYV